jgi:hypothetical protein
MWIDAMIAGIGRQWKLPRVNLLVRGATVIGRFPPLERSGCIGLQTRRRVALERAMALVDDEPL